MPNTIKVLRVFSSLGIGGVQKHYLKVISHLPTEEIEVGVCTFSDYAPLEDDYRKAGAAIYKGASQGKYNPITLFKLCKIIIRGRYNIIHASKMEDIIPITTLAAKITGRKLILQYHFPYKWLSKRKKIMDKVCAKISDKCLGVSRYVCKHITKELQINRCITIYNGTEIPKPLNQTFHHRKYIIFISRLAKFKRPDIFVKAAQLIHQKMKVPFLWLVSTSASDVSIDQYQNLPFISIKINEPNVSEFLQKSKIGVLTSSKEGLGNVVMEYMAHGVVPVISDIQAPKEIAPDHHYGIIFNPDNIQEFAKVLSLAYLNLKVAKFVALNNSKRVLNFDITRIAQKYADIYRKP